MEEQVQLRERAAGPAPPPAPLVAAGPAEAAPHLCVPPRVCPHCGTALECVAGKEPDEDAEGRAGLGDE